jgi:RNA polymerase subunit RPABC4/transcription elongation factor Spt4
MEKIKLTKLPDKLEEQMPEQLQLVRKFYFSKENTLNNAEKEVKSMNPPWVDKLIEIEEEVRNEKKKNPVIKEDVQNITRVDVTNNKKLIYCYECKKKLNAKAKFCQFCGTKVITKVKFCSACGEPIVNEYAKFCENCGAKNKPVYDGDDHKKVKYCFECEKSINKQARFCDYCGTRYPII